MKFKKLSACVLASALALTSLIGCGTQSQDDESKSKSKLNVGVFAAGYGTSWIYNCVEDFEKYYANTSFEDGKTGVQVIVEEKVEEFKGSNLSVSMPYLENALYVTQQSDYNMFLAKDLLADITDVINEKVYDSDGNLVEDKSKATVSILDNMNEYYLGYHERDGRYYGIPSSMHAGGIIYDADLFNKNKYYFFNDHNMGATQADIDKGTSGNIGAGPDGVVGTADDGMPETYKDFIKLIKKMANEDNVIPFTWAGSTSYQRMYAYDSVWANYQGFNDYSLNWSFNGTTTDGQSVSESNLEPLIEQQGRKAAIKFFYDIVSNQKYYSSKSASNGHTEAQFEYIDSINQNKRIAMFMEGGYWESEARPYFNNAAIIDEEMGYGKRDFRLMPIPNFIGTEGDGIPSQTLESTKEKEVLVGRQHDGLICISKKNASQNPEVQLELAKLFLQFHLSRKQMSNFTRDTGGVFMSYKFKATPEEVSSWTKYGQSVYRYIEEGSVMIPDIINNKKRENIYAASEYGWSFSYMGNVLMSSPVDVFKQFPNLDVNTCYENVKTQLRQQVKKY